MRSVYPKDSVLIQVMIPKRIRDKVMQISESKKITFAKAIEECLGVATDNIEDVSATEQDSVTC